MDERAQIEAIERVEHFISENIKNKISLHDIAQAVGYSPWHITKIFKKHTGKTIFDYLRSYRLSQAALILRDEKAVVLDVALDFVFATHEGFTRAFSREFGITPKRYAKTTPPIQLFMPYSVRDYYNYQNQGESTVEKKKETNAIFVQVVERPARKLLLKRGVKAQHYFEYCEEVGCDVWGVLCSVKNALNEPMGLWLPKNLMKEGSSHYVQGVEVPLDYTDGVPEGYEIIELKPCKMMIFQGQPYDDAIFEQAISEMWGLMKNYDPKVYGFEWAQEDAPRFQLEPQGYRGYMEGKPVRQIT